MVCDTSRTKRLAIVLFFLLTPFFPFSQSLAETRYVSDFLVINLKDNLEKPYQVVAKVKSNDPLIILEENDTYAKVETEGKQVGWIAKQYLTATLPKNLVIEQLRKEIEDLRANRPSAPASASSAAVPSVSQDILTERDRLQAELQAAMTRIAELQATKVPADGQAAPSESAEMNSEIKRLAEQKQQLESEIQALQVQYESLSDGSVDVPALIKEKEDLLAELQEKNEKITVLTAENEKLAKTAMIYWFCAGALVFVVGMFSGKLFGRKKTKYSY